MEDTERWRGRLRQVARRFVGDDEAEDIVQETLLRALVSPPPDPEAPMLPWLTVVARRLALDVLRKQRRLEPDEAVDERADPREAAPPAELGALLPGLGRLSPAELGVLLLRDGLELDVEATARALDTTGGTVRVAHHRARRKAAEGDDPGGGLDALDRFCTWLLARTVVGLPVRAVADTGPDPGFGGGVLHAHLRLLDAVVDSARRSDHRDLLARALANRGATRSVLRDGGALADLHEAHASGVSLDVVGLPVVRTLMDQGRLDEARSWCDRALAEVRRPHTRRALQALGLQLALDAGDTRGARAYEAALADVADTPGAEAMRHVGVGLRALGEERWTDARAAWWSAWLVVRDLGTPANELSVLNNLAFACLGAGRLEEAAQHLAAARRVAADGHLAPDRLGEVEGNEATLRMLHGDRAEAEVAFERLVRAASARGQAVLAELARVHLGVLALLRGDDGRASALLQESARALARGGPALAVAAELYREVARQRRDGPDAASFAVLAERARQAGRASTAEAARVLGEAARGAVPASDDPAPVVRIALWLSAPGRPDVGA